MSYKVLVACVIARDQGGHSHHYYDGAVIPWLADDQAEAWLAEGLVEKVGESPKADQPDDGAPAKVATKEVWVDYAVAKHGVDRAEAEALTKAELQELYG